jgi:DNA-binding MarR family transcriptional regulator
VGDDVEALLEQVRLVFHRAAQVVEDLHRTEGVTAGMRAVLELLHRTGPATVPQIARARFVTRQHIQTLVNALLDDGLVTTDTNPAHRTSALIRLTPVGRETGQRIRRRERRYLAALDLPVDRERLADATATLAALLDAFGRP